MCALDRTMYYLYHVVVNLFVFCSKIQNSGMHILN